MDRQDHINLIARCIRYSMPAIADELLDTLSGLLAAYNVQQQAKDTETQSKTDTETETKADATEKKKASK